MGRQQTFARWVAAMLLYQIAFSASAQQAAGPTLHLLNQTQSLAWDHASSVVEYAVSPRGELKQGVSLVAISFVETLKRKIAAVHSIGPWIFVVYPEGVPTSVAAYNTRSQNEASLLTFNPDQKGMLIGGYAASPVQQGGACSLWFAIEELSVINAAGTKATGGRDSLISTCVDATGKFNQTRDRWSDLNDPFWDGGQIGENTQDILVVHHDPANITPAAPGIPSISLAPTPPQWRSTPLGAADVAGANEEYLVLRDRNGPDRTTLLVWNRKSRQWSSVPQPPGRFAYRIFGSWLTATALTCETPEDSLDETCVSQAKSMIDLRTGKTLPIEDAGKDSEIILLAPDGKGLFRQGSTLSTFTAGSPASAREKSRKTRSSPMFTGPGTGKRLTERNNDAESANTERVPEACGGFHRRRRYHGSYSGHRPGLQWRLHKPGRLRR